MQEGGEQPRRARRPAPDAAQLPAARVWGRGPCSQSVFPPLGRASGSELGSCVEGLAELLHGCNLSGSMAAAGAWFEEQGLDTVAELKKARMEADFVAALQLKPGKERVLLADIDSFY